MRSTKDLADAIHGGNVTEAILENIESGRKASLDVSQILNIAMALRVPLSYLLAPLGKPDSALDLPNLSDSFSGMTAVEFDAWLSSSAEGPYRPSTLDERNAVSELQALRAWSSQKAEVERLEAMVELEREALPDGDLTYVRSTKDRLIESRQEANRLTAFLQSAGWTVP